MPDPQGVGTGTYEYRMLASRLQGVWARENTRAALFSAMRRKKTYATTGTGITVRVFAGWDFDAADVLRPDFAKTGYGGGVPIGVHLRPRSGTSAEGGPRLLYRSPFVGRYSSYRSSPSGARAVHGYPA